MKESLSEELKRRTEPEYAKLHSAPYFTAIQQGRFDPLAYANHLHSLGIIWTSLEHQLRLSRVPACRVLKERLRSKWPALQGDLKTLGASETSTPIVLATLDAVSSMLRRIADTPASILGFLYVMEGSLQGGSILKGFVDAALPVRNATRYFGRVDHEVWNTLRASIDRDDWEDGQREAIVHGALELFRQLHELFSRISEVSGTRAPHITAVNPEAGNHAMPSDPRAVSAALRAGLLAWSRYPYLKARFGERGLRFTKSDSCWLATLIDRAQPDLDGQSLWLGRLLAARGIPTVILETHLEMLSEELAGVQGAPFDTHEKLRVAAEMLRRRRRAFLSDANFDMMVDDLEGWLERRGDVPKRSGPVIVSALADEAGGVSNAGRNVVVWYSEHVFGDAVIRAEFESLIHDLSSGPGFAR